MQSATRQDPPRGVTIERAEFDERRARLRERAAERGLDGVLVVSRGANGADWGGDVVYLTNHYSPFPQIPDRPPAWSGRGHGGLVMPVGEDGTLVVEIPDWREDLVAIDDVRVSLDLWAGLASALGDRGLATGRIGLIGRESLPYIAIDRIRQELPGIEFVWADEIIEDMRLRKSDAEIALMRESTRVGGEMVQAFVEAAVPGATEADCVLAALARGIPQGAFPLDIPVASGANVDHFQWDRMPSWDWRRELQAGDMIHPDMYGTVNGYFYDLVRTTVAGRKVSDAQREVLEGSVAVVEHVVEAMRPGVSCEQLFDRGSQWLGEHGFDAPGAEAAEGVAYLGQSFPSFGHSLGLTWEHPWLMPGESTKLEAGMVFAVEAEVGRPGAGTGAFEHDVLITDDGHEILTASVKNVWWE
ncbi:MAG TPA: M24 family metallopeptidase [Microbacteriaceae bacterium]|jgi:Xaa-Pro aminopeptidase|nr:M24 family metallopeptidase [Microbacteriaceae bacterium]